MSTILVAGGNSGIGQQAAHDLVARGHRLVLLGRDAAKGERVLASFAETADRVEFVAADLSTHEGVRAAATAVLDRHDRLDAIVHATGVFLTAEERTADGLHPFLAVNYLSRYHLTQLLLPALLGADTPRVVMMTAKVAPDTAIEFDGLDAFPTYQPFNLTKVRKPIQVANHHYAAYLARTHPGMLTGVVNAGAAKTDILRRAPWYVRAGATVSAPLMFNSLEQSAHNVVESLDRTNWAAPTYWPKPGDFNKRTPIAVDPKVTSEVIRISHNLTQA